MAAAAQTTLAEPTPTNAAKSAIYKFASQLAEKLGYDSASDLEGIVGRLGGEIRYTDWGLEDDGGSLEVCPDQTPGFIIRLHTFAGKLRNRFTIAHELGHYFLHSDGGQKRMVVNRAGSGRLEWEANWFAGAFLLPEERFRKDWERYGHCATRIASVYKVSVAVVEIRCEELGLK
ncbi:MAG: ImmA/IrrE family metallo-endopeptidase [Verrucomicrobiaceae bacterium]|nr:ImmA/IrrE family metallo-endopeptidase [Verrucomicrobiaceae bacterium]